MEKLFLKSDKANFYSKMLRAVLATFGFIYLASSLTEILPTFEFSFASILNGLLGLAFIVGAFMKSMIGANVELLLTDEFLRTTENVSYIRTAYWKKLNRLILTKFSLRIEYTSGMKERFRLPFLTNKQFKKLRSKLNNKSVKYDFELQEKSWWNIF